MNHPHPWVILFDIDGTLLTVDHNFNRPLLRYILDKLEINYPDMESDAFSGRTDHDIFSSFLVNHEFDQRLYQRMKETYLKELNEKLDHSRLIRHNHIDDALDYFSEERFVRGLLTGNYPEAAEIKLNAAHISHSFSFGAFGESDKDRNRLPAYALDYIREAHKTEPDPARFVIIGDTPRDIICAKKAGMKIVAVTTGKFSHQELAEHQPDLIIDSLAQPEVWFSKLTAA